jgi:hypothetical protein
MSPAKGLDPQVLTRELEHFLAGSRDAQIIEDGRVLFDLRQASYSVTGQYGKCLLHFWSQERNAVRRVLEAKTKNATLKLTVQLFGRPKPSHLEVVRGNDSRSPSSRKAARARYEELLQRVIELEFPRLTADRLRSTADLERSFSPVYARGLLRAGRTAFAVLGVNAAESQAAVDGSLTFGLLWLDYCRQQLAGKAHVEGLKLFVPRGCSDVVRERMAHLNHAAAKFELWDLDERERSTRMLDCADRGNISTRLVHCVLEKAVRERFAASVNRVTSLAGEHAQQIELAPLSAAEISFRVHGLEFARARWGADPRSFSSGEEIVFGVGAAAHLLDAESEPMLRELMLRLLSDRREGGDHANGFYRMHSERWLESLVISDVSLLDSRLATRGEVPVYSQVPAFSASDRAMIDVLTLTRERRLAVIELKADEDLHLPMQGLDYWARVQWHHQRGEFQRFGYFPGLELSSAPPLLLLAAPALRVHPATDLLLRYISPDIDYTLLGIDEHWRGVVRVIFRKHRTAGAVA